MIEIRISLSYGPVAFIVTNEGHGYLFSFDPNNYLGSATLAFVHLLSQNACGEITTLLGIRREFHEQIMDEILAVKKMPWKPWPTVTELSETEALKAIKDMHR